MVELRPLIARRWPKDAAALGHGWVVGYAMEQWLGDVGCNGASCWVKQKLSASYSICLHARASLLEMMPELWRYMEMMLERHYSHANECFKVEHATQALNGTRKRMFGSRWTKPPSTANLCALASQGHGAGCGLADVFPPHEPSMAREPRQAARGRRNHPHLRMVQISAAGTMVTPLRMGRVIRDPQEMMAYPLVN